MRDVLRDGRPLLPNPLSQVAQVYVVSSYDSIMFQSSKASAHHRFGKVEIES